MSPLTKKHRSNPDLTERFELFGVSAYSSKDAVVSYINGYVEMVLQAGH